MKKIIWIGCIFLSLNSSAQKKNHSEQIAATVLQQWPDTITITADAKDINASSQALLLKGMEAVWTATGRRQYFEYIRNTVDQYLQPDGSVKKAVNINPRLAESMLLVYQVTKKERYRKAADQLPRINGYGLNPAKTVLATAGDFELAGFSTAYHSLFNPDSIAISIKALVMLNKKEASLETTALAGLALLDAIERVPAQSPAGSELISHYQSYAARVRALQNPVTNVWSARGKSDTSVDQRSSLLIIYTLLKGLRRGYIDGSTDGKRASSGYKYIMDQYKSSVRKGMQDKAGKEKTDAMAGAETAAAMMLAAREAELATSVSIATGKRVLLDYYYNNEREKDARGREVRYHYTWEDRANSGYYVLGKIFEAHGASLARLETSAASLKKQDAGLYIIVDPDTEKESAKPNYLQAADIKNITDWVNDGGVLVLLGNDKGNAEFTHFNQLASQFGITFNEDKQNAVLNDQFEQGVVMTPAGSEVFGSEKKLYIKEFSSLKLVSPAYAILTKDSLNVMAVSPYGKGLVVAMGDPWIYNEYVDGRKLPDDFKNFEATVEWTKWLLNKASKMKSATK